MPMQKDSDDEEIALAIELGSMCRALQCLPGPGGLMDQDAYLLKLVEYYMMAASEKEAKDNAVRHH